MAPGLDLARFHAQRCLEPVGVEVVINRHMKRRGMRWCGANADGIVALREDTTNADWDAESLRRLAG